MLVSVLLALLGSLMIDMDGDLNYGVGKTDLHVCQG